MVNNKIKESRERPEDLIGKTFNDGKLKVVSIIGKDTHGHALFKVTCTECSKDPELFPDGYFVSSKGSLKKGSLPCGCSKRRNWKDWQYLILARRAGEGRFIIHGFSENFHGKNTKLNLECIKDRHKWSASVDSVINSKQGCPKCGGSLKLTEQEAFNRCKLICDKMDYKPIGFVNGYKNNKSKFEYKCPNHGIQTVAYSDFVYAGKRCGDCWREKQKDLGNLYGYYPERAGEQDFLYVLNFNDKFIKVGRSFDVDDRVSKLKAPSASGIKNVNKLRIFTATHQEIYDLEQELHSELRERCFQYFVPWSTECFENESLFILNKLLDNCGFEELF